MKAIILAFLLQLDAIGAADPSMYDLRVLAAVHKPIQATLVEGRGEVVLPQRFGLASAAGEQQLRQAVERFIREARASGELATANSSDARIDLLYSDGTQTPAGHAFDDYFAFAQAN